MEPGVWLWIWLVLAVGLSIAEIFTAGFFLLPFGIGAAVAAALEFLLPGSLALQWVAFIGVSVLSFLGLQRFAARVTHESPVKVAGDRLVGKVGTVIEAFDHGRAGAVRVEREEWRADTSDRSNPEVGSRVEVVAVEGAHLVVKSAAEASTDEND